MENPTSVEKTPPMGQTDRWDILLPMSNETVGRRHPKGPPHSPGERREATVREAKAMAHPLRLRILRLCLHQELTNKQLAERLGRDPGTVLYHVRHLTDAGLLEQGAIRTGESGALEKPYRSTGLSWWLSNPSPEQPLAPIEAFHE